MRIAIDQPNYIPWKGYFDLIHDVDLFVFYNDVQYTSRDWRNRNQVMTKNGPKWLSIPVGNKVHSLICDVKIPDSTWQKKHFSTLQYTYAKAPYFRKYKEFLEYVYLDRQWDYLYELDQYMIEYISKEFLGIKTKFADSREYNSHGAKHEKLLSLIENIGADSYLSGPKAKDYIQVSDYRDKNIELLWKNYDGYPEYPQNTETFTHFVSILDLLFNVGDDSPYYIWGWREDSLVSSWDRDEVNS